MPTPEGAKYDDFAEWKRSVERRLRQALAQGASRPQMEVSEGGFDVTNNGAVRIFGSGGLTLTSGDGVDIFSAKGWPDPYNEPDGDAQPMVQIKRADGSIAFFLGDPLPNVDGYQQFWAWYDRQGTIVFGDDTTSGRGLARPYGAMSVIPATSAGDVTLTSTTSFADSHIIAGPVQNPRMQIPVSASAPATGPGEVRVWHGASGTVCAGPTAIPAGTNVAPFYEFDVPASVAMFSHQYFSVQTRRVSGTGNITSRVYNAHGDQS